MVGDEIHFPSQAGCAVRWKIEQHGEHEWAVRGPSNEVHFAQTPESAVALKRALEKEEQ